MPKPSKQQLSTKMQERNPLDMRQQIVPVDALLTERVEGTNRSNDEGESPEKRIESSINVEHSTERVERTGVPIDGHEGIHPIKEVNGNPEQTSEREYPSDKPIGKPEQKQRSTKARAKLEQTNERSKREDKPNARGDTSKRTILQELRQGVDKTERPHTERYSFEIYPDQKDRIKEFQDLYQQKTGRKLSASRILREGLDMYLEKAFQLLNERA